MVEFIIFYLIGYILSVVVSLYFSFRKWNEITIQSIAVSILLSSLSWISIIVFACVFGDNIVIYRKIRK